MAIGKVVSGHKCNVFCDIVGLKSLNGKLYFSLLSVNLAEVSGKSCSLQQVQKIVFVGCDLLNVIIFIIIIIII